MAATARIKTSATVFTVSVEPFVVAPSLAVTLQSLHRLRLQVEAPPLQASPGKDLSRKTAEESNLLFSELALSPTNLLRPTTEKPSRKSRRSSGILL